MLTLKVGAEEFGVAKGTVTLPRVGMWHADLTVISETIPSGQVTAVLSTVDMVAHVQRAELVNGVLSLRLVGGFGGMGRDARAKHYRNPLVKHVLNDLLVDAGERLSSTSTAASLATALSYWTTLVSPTGAIVQALADVAGEGVSWRMRHDGALWFGVETWPESPADVRVLEQDATNAAQIVGTDACGIWPGTTVGGRRVDLAVHEIGGTPRSTLWFAEEHS